MRGGPNLVIQICAVYQHPIGNHNSGVFAVPQQKLQIAFDSDTIAASSETPIEPSKQSTGL